MWEAERMPAETNEQDISSTHTSTTEIEIVISDIVASEEEINNSCAIPHSKGQTASSMKTEGRVWLHYVPREHPADISETT